MPHKYADLGHYAEFTLDQRFYLIFETDGRKVTLIRAGRPSSRKVRRKDAFDGLREEGVPLVVFVSLMYLTHAASACPKTVIT
jgi:hypothetical protein